MLLEILQVFVLGFLIDILYIAWMYSTQQNNYLLAVLSTVSISACSLFGFINVYDDRVLAVPYLIGLVLGTIVGIFLKKRISI